LALFTVSPERLQKIVLCGGRLAKIRMALIVVRQTAFF
jgi:hypothetical protein